MDAKELKAKLAEFDDEIDKARMNLIDAQSELEFASARRRNFARVYCKHQKTYHVVGEAEIRCRLCDEEV
jgi:hypothetical protein